MLSSVDCRSRGSILSTFLINALLYILTPDTERRKHKSGSQKGRRTQHAISSHFNLKLNSHLSEGKCSGQVQILAHALNIFLTTGKQIAKSIQGGRNGNIGCPIGLRLGTLARAYLFSL